MEYYYAEKLNRIIQSMDENDFKVLSDEQIEELMTIIEDSQNVHIAKDDGIIDARFKFGINFYIECYLEEIPDCEDCTRYIIPKDNHFRLFVYEDYWNEEVMNYDDITAIKEVVSVRCEYDEVNKFGKRLILEDDCYLAIIPEGEIGYEGIKRYTLLELPDADMEYDLKNIKEENEDLEFGLYMIKVFNDKTGEDVDGWNYQELKEYFGW